jgi:predicted nucleic acid-binding protein
MIVYLDTNIVIYTVEQNPVYGPKARTRLATARAAGDTLMISDLTRMECLVGPLKSGDTAVEADYHTFWGDKRGGHHRSRL